MRLHSPWCWSWAPCGNGCSHQTPAQPRYLSFHVGKIAEQYPWLETTGVLEVILPKKQELTLIKL